MKFLSLFFISSLVFAQSGVEDLDTKLHKTKDQGFVIEKPKTAEEAKIDKEYVNQEYNQKMKDQACKDLMKEAGAVFKADGSLDTEKSSKRGQINPCDSATVDDEAYVVNPMIDKMIPVLGKAYGTVFGMGGGTFTSYTKAPGDAKGFVAKEGGGTTTDKSKAESKEKKDICAPIPMVTEMGAQAYQMATQNNIQQQNQQAEKSNAEMQTENMYSIARMHETRKQTATFQGVGWGATAACYTAYIASTMGTGTVDIKIPLKLSVAAAFTVFYGLKAKNHKDWADKIKNKANKLKDLFGKHNCDPVGEKQCYCSMDSTKMDPNVCLKKPKNGKNPNIAHDQCIGASAQLDPNCDCLRTNKCFDQVLAGEGMNLNLGNTFFKSALGDVQKLATGGLDYSTLDGSSFGQLAMAKEALRKLEKEDLDIPKLNGAQTADAKMLMDAGLPPLAAALIASQPDTPAGRSYASSLRSGFSGSKYAAVNNNRPEESHLNFNNTAAKSRGGYDDDDRQAGGNKAIGNSGSSSGVEVMGYAQKAEKEAQIRKNPETPIFDIISYRYKTSAWKKFDVMNNPVAPAAPVKETK